MTPGEQASKALSYVLKRIQSEPKIAYFFHCTEAHEQMIDALAALTDENEDDIASRYEITKTESPSAGKDDDEEDDATGEADSNFEDSMIYTEKLEARLLALAQIYAPREYMSIHNDAMEMVGALERALPALVGGAK